ncbi:MAG: site-specific recombinase for integration and excision [Planctomycetota bacterium]|nr:site-specific recombinase for integration and excision [Planctomycetota bacterium]
MKVIGYVRVSTQEQADGGVSLAAQESKVRAYASLHDLEMVEVIVDAGESAKSLKRPGLQRALAMLKRGEVAGLVVAKMDRLSRSVGDWNDLIDGYFGERAGKSLMSVADSIDTRTAAGRLVLNVLMSVAQWEREAIGERTRDALAHKKSKGERVGQIPFGFKTDDGVNLTEDATEQEAIGVVEELRADGLSCRAIAGEMNARGLKTKGNGKWHETTVRRILAQTA